MATMFMCNTPMDLDLSYYSNSTTTTTSPASTISPASSTDDCYNWNDFSPVVDWGEISESNSDVNELIESMIDHDANVYHRDRPILERSDSVVSPEIQMPDFEDNTTEDAKGLRLVHLLMAAAEALTGITKSRELARVILVRLRGLVSTNEGTNMERLAADFTEALQGLLEGNGAGGVHCKAVSNLKDDHHKSDVIAAFQLLQDMSPYVKFGHFTANQAILEAVENDRRVHIVDYDIMEGIQWASLMQSLVSRKNCTPISHLRITALSRGGGSGRRSFVTIQETGRRLSEFAKSIGLSFSFHQCRLDSDETFRVNSLKLVRGEALVMNCMLHLPHFSYRAPESIASFLSGAKELKARLVTLVEEEVSPTNEGGFVAKFMESLHHYSAVYDSLEAGFPMEGQARALVERIFLGPRIAASVAQIYHAKGIDEGFSWGERMAQMGFCPNSISFSNNCQAKLLLGLFNHGYRVEELGNNKLVLGWMSRRMLSASIWTCQDY